MFEEYNNTEDFLAGESAEKSLWSINERIDQIVGTSQKNVKKKTFFSKNIRFILVFLILIISTGIFYNSLLNKAKFPSSLASSYYEPYPNYKQFTVRGIEHSTDLKSAYSAYDQGDFVGSCFNFQQNLQNLDSEDKFYYGISLLGDGQWGKSLTIFSSIENDIHPDYRHALSWYKALGLLGSNKNEEAKNVLKTLVYKPGPFSEKAQDLLNER